MAHTDTPKSPPQKAGSWGQWLTDRAIRTVIWLLLALPYRWRVPLCGWVMARIVAPLAGWPQRIRDNLALTLPDLPAAQIDRMVARVPENIGRTVIEIYSGAEFIARTTELPLTGDGVAALEAAHAAKRPVILATGHFGNYDAVRAALIARGYSLGALYRPMSNPWFNDHYVQAIGTIGQPLFERGRQGMGQMLKHLRGGGMLGILPDQRMQKGVKLTFFGKEALTALSAADMALKYDAMLIPTYAIRQPDGLSFQIVVDPPIPPSTPEIMTQALNDNLERLIRQYPEQWFWIHRRWKP
ncbi:lysophospholipid acyltransferase family protein [Pseudotabrizicola alkalilacus]|uniref:Lauroyl acyltransferase n=1 Tax=Pseudotabrizicola alkalilacus TaxID=2305252 RepID=A0A411Z438_9RHOB|nr:lysophospholipid acyltransferase family protein [Pseudotabrizicola alkalilacus]RGP37792.1 lauroyl acyltransferase [Pseudotabrizicola alkalilacus]